MMTNPQTMTNPTWATAESNGTTGPMPIATIAASASAQDATGDGAIVVTPIESPPIEGESNPCETPANTKRYMTVTNCEHCGREFVALRPWTRFCTAYCRRRAWLARNPDKAAELAERDKARLRLHFEERGREWADKVTR